MIAYGIWCCFTTRGRRTTHLHPSVWIALGMTGIILSHVLSVLLAVFAILPALIVATVRGDRKLKGWISLMCSGLIALLLSAWFVIPFLHWYLTQDMVVKHSAMLTAEYASKMTGTLGQLLAIFPTMYGTTGDNTTVSYQRMPLALGVGGLSFVIVGMLTVLLFKQKVRGRISMRKKASLQGGENLTILLASFIVLVICCCCSFVWTDKVGLMTKLAVIQFPWRLIGPMLFVSACIGVISLGVIQNNDVARKSIYVFCVAISLLTVVEGGHSMTSVAYEMPSQQSIEDINEELIPAQQDIGVGEYLPANVSYSSIKTKMQEIKDGDFEYSFSTSGNGGRVFNVDVPSNTNKLTFELPLIYYEGYKL